MRTLAIIIEDDADVTVVVRRPKALPLSFPTRTVDTAGTLVRETVAPVIDLASRRRAPRGDAS